MKVHVSKAKKGVGLEANQIGINQVQNQQVVNVVQPNVQQQKIYTTFDEFLTDNMEALERCKVDRERDVVKNLIREALATFTPDKMSFKPQIKKVVLRHGIPLFKDLADMSDWAISAYQECQLMTVLIPEPSDKSFKKIANVYRTFPNSTEFLATAAYFMIKCLRLGNRIRKITPVLEKLWSLKAKENRGEYLKLLKKQSDTVRTIWFVSMRIGKFCQTCT